jgi:hypothetical protein
MSLILTTNLLRPEAALWLSPAIAFRGWRGQSVRPAMTIATISHPPICQSRGDENDKTRPPPSLAIRHKPLPANHLLRRRPF